MSCATQTQQPVKFIVSMGSLPEGFCGTPQELAQAVADRLIIQSDPVYSSFAIGSTAPTSNVGPWLKDCMTWYVWDDTLGMYVPMTKQGFSQQEYFISSSSFVVPADIYKLKITAIGGGGGGMNVTGGQNGIGGAGGGFSLKLHAVSPGASITIIVGTGGTNGGPGGTVGGDTTVADGAGVFMTASGGAPGAQVAGQNDTASVGGLATGGDINIQGGGSDAAYGGPKGGGSAGGWGGSGGNVDIANAAHRKGIAPGGGGSGGIAGAGDTLGGVGANGCVLIEW